MVKSIVFLHGWGSDSRSWQPLLPLIHARFPSAQIQCIDLPAFGGAKSVAEFELQQVIDQLAAQILQPSIVVGWSLGGMLAVRLAQAYPQKVSALITLAANAKFVADVDYPTAMPREVNQQFNSQFQISPMLALKLFAGLMAQGDLQERALLKQMRALMQVDSAQLELQHPHWLAALYRLSELDNRQLYVNLSMPCLHLFAESDVLVPVVAAPAIKALNRSHQVEVIKGAAHALHWSQPERVAQTIVEFCVANSLEDFSQGAAATVIDKKKIAHSFGRAAAQYDSIANFQQHIGRLLQAQLPEQPTVEWVVDLGCGTGAALGVLQAKYPSAHCVALDLSEVMLAQAAPHFSGAVRGVNGDAEALPFADQSIDLVYSNLVVQWCGPVDQLLSEIARVLKPGGRLLLSTLVEKSLCELKAAWASVDSQVHVNNFHALSDWKAALNHYFPEHQLENWLHQEWFADLKLLTRSIKGIGAKNLNHGRPAGLSGRHRIDAFRRAYEMNRTAAGLPLTYDLLLLSAVKKLSS